MNKTVVVIIGCLLATMLTVLGTLAIADSMYGAGSKAPAEVPAAGPKTPAAGPKTPAAAEAGAEPSPGGTMKWVEPRMSLALMIATAQYVALVGVVIFFMVVAHRAMKGIESQAAATARLATLAEEFSRTQAPPQSGDAAQSPPWWAGGGPRAEGREGPGS